MMNKKLLCLFVLLFVFSLFFQGCITKQEALNFGKENNSSKGKITVMDGTFTNKIPVQNQEFTADSGKQYTVIKIKIRLTRGNWNEISEFEFRKREANALSIPLDEILTEKLNEKNIFEINSKEAETVNLVYVLDSGETDISDFGLNIHFKDGAISSLFVMSK